MKPLKNPRPWVVALLTSFLCAALIAVGGYFYTNQVQRESRAQFEESIRRSEQQWCAIIGLFDRAYGASPPTSETGKLVAEQMHLLFLRFGCETK